MGGSLEIGRLRSNWYCTLFFGFFFFQLSHFIVYVMKRVLHSLFLMAGIGQCHWIGSMVGST